VTSTNILVVFFGLAYAWAWLIYVPIVLLHAPLHWTVLGTFGPTLAAVATHRLATGGYRPFRLWSTVSRTLAGIGLGVALILLAYVVLPGMATADPTRLNWSILTSTAVYNYSTLLGGPVGEEPGWRGYALPRLEAALGPVRGTLVLAVLWAGWHLPLFWYPGWTSAPFWIYLLMLIGLAVIFSFAVNLSRFCVITAIVMHAAFNTASRFLGGLFAYTEPRTSVPFELVLALCGLSVALVLTLATRGRLAYEMTHDGS
jgi:membrane protease YdiL (CAAX protease family)